MHIINRDTKQTNASKEDEEPPTNETEETNNIVSETCIKGDLSIFSNV